MSLYSDIIAASDPRETIGDVIDWFKGEYPASKWKGKLADRLAPIAGVQRDTIMRRFQKGRTGKAKSQEQTAREYKSLGEELPPMPPENGFHIWGEVWAKFSDGACESRDVDEYITGAEAAHMVKMASEEIAQMVVDHYMGQDPDEPIASIGDCQPPRLHVEANEGSVGNKRSPDWEE